MCHGRDGQSQGLQKLLRVGTPNSFACGVSVTRFARCTNSTPPSQVCLGACGPRDVAHAASPSWHRTSSLGDALDLWSIPLLHLANAATPVRLKDNVSCPHAPLQAPCRGPPQSSHPPHGHLGAVVRPWGIEVQHLPRGHNTGRALRPRKHFPILQRMDTVWFHAFW